MLHAVTAEHAGKRADVVIASLSGASRSLVAQSARRGEIFVNGMAAKPSRLLEEGDVLQFQIAPPDAPVATPQQIELDLVYEDDDILVVDKAAGMVTHPALGARDGTLVNALLAHVGSPLPGDALRPGLVHRLDRDTSGLLLVAKTEDSLRTLRAAMKRRDVGREYLGLVVGVPEHDRGTIAGAIGRDPRNRLRFAIAGDGKPATTHYELREAFGKHAELTFRLETGRTHQIRVHLAAAGHPLLNDPLYGRTEPRFQLPGQALHAWRLRFVHPRTADLMDFECDPPPAYRHARALLDASR